MAVDGTDPRPPGDRTPENDLLAEVRQLAERFERFASQPPQVRLTPHWWDELVTPYPGDTLRNVVAPNHYQEWRLTTTKASSYVVLRCNQMADGIELTLLWDHCIVWQRKLFYEPRGERG